jgi:hypothetical protein
MIRTFHLISFIVILTKNKDKRVSLLEKECRGSKAEKLSHPNHRTIHTVPENLTRPLRASASAVTSIETSLFSRELKVFSPMKAVLTQTGLFSGFFRT